MNPESITKAAELKQDKAENKRLNKELEQKVEERTRELATTNEALRSEIAERRLAVEAVKQAEDRIRLIIDTIPTMAWSLRPDGAVDFVNQRWLDYTGLSLEEEIAEPTRAMHPEDLSSAVEKWLGDMAAGEPFERELRLRRADGEYRWFLVRTAPLRDEDGNIVKWFGSSIDIEDRKQAEKDLEEANRQLKTLSRRRVKVQEEERRHLARELHDEIGQALTAAKINLQSVMGNGGSGNLARLRETTAILEQLLGQVRQISLNLRPSMLDDLGLVPALRSLVDEQGRRASIQIHFTSLQRTFRKISIPKFRRLSSASCRKRSRTPCVTQVPRGSMSILAVKMEICGCECMIMAEASRSNPSKPERTGLACLE